MFIYSNCAFREGVVLLYKQTAGSLGPQCRLGLKLVLILLLCFPTQPTRALVGYSGAEEEVEEASPYPIGSV